METRVSSEYSPPPYAPGVRFTPDDVELVKEYLKVKLSGKELPCDIIKEENVYAYNPEELTKRYRAYEDNWYFFTPRNRKYAHGSRPSRSAGDGYWKATGSDKDIINEKGQKIAVKKSLTFHLGEQPGGTKTKWLMDEYRIDEFQQPIHPGTKNMLLDTSVLCRIHYGRYGSRGPTSSRNATNKKEADNTIEDSLLPSAEADQPDETTDNAPALAEVVAVEPTNSIRQDQLNPSIFAPESEAGQADATTDNPPATTDNPPAMPESNNIFQDQFNPSTLENFDEGPWDSFHSQVAPSLDILNDCSFNDQVYGDSVDQCLPLNSEHLDFDDQWTYWDGEVDENAKLQKSSLDEANTQAHLSRLGDSTMKTQAQQGLGTSTMNTQEQQSLDNSTVNTQKQQAPAAPMKTREH